MTNVRAPRTEQELAQVSAASHYSLSLQGSRTEPSHVSYLMSCLLLGASRHHNFLRLKRHDKYSYFPFSVSVSFLPCQQFLEIAYRM